MLYFGKLISVSLLPLLLLTMPPNAAGLQLEQPGAAAVARVQSGTDANNKGTASESPSPGPETVKPSVESGKASWSSALRTLLVDQKDIWLAPSKIGTQQLPWLLPIAGATAVMTQFDTRVAGSLPNTSTQLSIGRAVSHAGELYPLAGLAASFYFAGRWTGSGRARETGLLTAEALAQTQSVIQVMKWAFRRERPDDGAGQGRFWTSDDSFPSGHAASTWAAAAVISREYHDNTLVRYGIYALPIAVSAARVGARRHFVSDVIAGALVGNLIGAFVYRRHHDPQLGGAPVGERSRAVPIPGVQLDPRSRTYALSLSWQP